MKNYLIIFLFLFAILSPSLGLLLGVSSKIDNYEYRHLTPFPDLSQKDTYQFLTKNLTDYFNDNFGFRSFMIKQYSEIKLNILGIAPQPEVIIGKNGWIFGNAVYRSNIKDWYKTKVSFSPKELETITKNLQAEKDWLDQKNIPYYLVLVPDKDVVYPEYYPYQNNHLTNIILDQLISYLKSHTTLEIIDLRKPLIKAKSTLPVYFLTDYHWNSYGSYIGYQEIIQRFKNQNDSIIPYQISDFNVSIKPYNYWSGDLLPFSFYWKNRQPETYIKLTPKKDQPKKLSSVLIHGDSFAEAKRFINRKLFEEQFPTLKNSSRIFFTDSQADELQPKTTVDELIPLIYQNIPDPITQKKFISFLLNNRILDENPVGINYFLNLNFNRVINADYHTAIDKKLIDQENPKLVIREVIQQHLYNFSLIKAGN